MIVRLAWMVLLVWGLGLALGGCAVAHMKTAEVRAGEGVGPITLGMPMRDVRWVLGEPVARKELDSGIAYAYPSQGVSIFGDEQDGVLRITCGHGFVGDVSRIRDFWGRTAEDIGIGSTREEVIKTYGAPEGGDVLVDVNPRSHEGTLVYWDKGISFRFQEDVVVRMQVFRRGGRGVGRH